MSQESVDVVDAMGEAWNGGDMDAFGELLAPDVIVRAPDGWPEPGPFVGREAVMRQWERNREAWDSDTFEIVGDPIDAGDRVVVRLIWTGIRRDLRTQLEFTAVYTLRKGKVSYQESFWDHAEALEAMGLSGAQENVDVVRRSVDHWNSGDVGALVATFTDDAELRPAPGFVEGEVLFGHEGIRHFFERLHEAWKPGDTVTLGDVRETGNKVIFSFRWRAIGDVSGIETTSEWIAVDTFRDGLIARMEIFSDRAEALEAMGISESPHDAG
jgi:ketosteroid isomerase-like protein